MKDEICRVYAQIDLDAVKSNFEQMKSNLNPNCQMIAVIKANAYGHGAVKIAHLIEDYDYIWGFAVATIEEAIELRDENIKKPILILGVVFPKDYKDAVKYDLRLATFELSMAKLLSDEAILQNKKAFIHLALDTGMSRIGLKDSKEGVLIAKEISRLPNIEMEGLFTHFARADEADLAPAKEQLKKYLEFVEMLEKEGIKITIKHASNSAGIIRFQEANLNAVRAGITIYGLYPSEEVEKDVIHLKPVMSLKSRISYIKEIEAGVAIGYGGTYVAKRKMKVATIPVGYADGYARTLSNKGEVLIRGRRSPIVGRVCMDQFMVDVSDIPDVQKFDEVTLIGTDGNETISVEELGELSGRFNYEFVCEISNRVPRRYTDTK